MQFYVLYDTKLFLYTILNSNVTGRTILAEDPIDSKYYDSRSHRDVGVKSRLDSVPNKPRTMGVLSRPKTSPSSSSQSTGYRIVVSNLQANVTQEDIKVEFASYYEINIDFRRESYFFG